MAYDYCWKPFTLWQIFLFFYNKISPLTKKFLSETKHLDIRNQQVVFLLLMVDDRDILRKMADMSINLSVRSKIVSVI